LDNHILGEELLSFYPNESVDTLSVMAGLMKERAVFVHDIVTEGDYLINKPTDYDKPTVAKKWKPESAGIMAIWLTILSDISDFSTENVETSFKAYLEEQGLSFGAAMPQFRLLLTGKGMGPGIFEIASFLGKDECILRMKAGLNFIK
jgi:glutamyl-tRNA synthetase